jgi:hypothetical protein
MVFYQERLFACQKLSEPFFADLRGHISSAPFFFLALVYPKKEISSVTLSHPGAGEGAFLGLPAGISYLYFIDKRKIFVGDV